MSEPRISPDDLTSDQYCRVLTALTRLVEDEDGSDCRVWVGPVSETNTPCLLIDDLVLDPRRLSYYLSIGPVGSSDVVEAACENPRCVSPDHLVLYRPSHFRSTDGLDSPSQHLSEDQIKHHTITQEAYDTMLRAQGGVCAVCQIPDPLVIDWDFRHCLSLPCDGACAAGLLCEICLDSIEEIRTDLAWYTEASAYLARREN